MWMDINTSLSEVPVNIVALIDDTDFKSREESVAYNATGLELIWHFTTTGGNTTHVVVTPTTGGDYDWAHQDGGLYTIEIPASGGASINNDAKGFGWFTGVADGVLPWTGPIIGFRQANVNNVLIDNDWDTKRGFTGTALPDAVADAAGGIPVSDAGGLDLDALKAVIDELIVHETTIASVTDDKTFILTSSGLDGDTSADDDAWNNASVTIEDVTGTAKELRTVEDYAGATKTITLDRNCKFSLAAGDKVRFFPSCTVNVAGVIITAADKADLVDLIYEELDSEHMTPGTKGLKIHHSGRGRY